MGLSALNRRNSEYPLYDGHGSERTVTSSNQTVTGTINFEAFGQTVGTSGSSSSPYMYAGAWGYRTDGDAGLMHVGARYYDAQVGRFITRDTVLSEHPYLYCEHDPVNAVDPSGHAPDVMGWLGQTLGLDFNFDHDGWHTIIDGWQSWANAEMYIGGGGFIGAGGLASFLRLPWQKPVSGSTSLIWRPTPEGQWLPPGRTPGATPVEVITAAGSGIWIAGALVKVGAGLVDHLVDWIFRP